MQPKKNLKLTSKTFNFQVSLVVASFDLVKVEERFKDDEVIKYYNHLDNQCVDDSTSSDDLLLHATDCDLQPDRGAAEGRAGGGEGAHARHRGRPDPEALHRASVRAIPDLLTIQKPPHYHQGCFCSEAMWAF